MQVKDAIIGTFLRNKKALVNLTSLKLAKVDNCRKKAKPFTMWTEVRKVGWSWSTSVYKVMPPLMEVQKVYKKVQINVNIEEHKIQIRLCQKTSEKVSHVLESLSLDR